MDLRSLIYCALAAFYFSAASFGLPVYWVDWVSGAPGPNGSAQGVITIGSDTVNVNYSGEAGFIQTDGGVNYWVPNAPYLSAAVDNAPPNSDIIATWETTRKTLTFSRPVDNLIFAIVSLDHNGYFFDQPFNVESYGQGFWGDGYFISIATVSGDWVAWGFWEAHGVIRFEEPVQSLSWTTYKSEYWNGFTVGTYGVVGFSALSVVTPDGGASAALLGISALSLLIWSRKRPV